MSSGDQRTIFYVDGFNLYFGLREQGWRKYYWLNLVSFARSVLRADQHFVRVKYFTSRISDPVDKMNRQNAYLTALKTLPTSRSSRVGIAANASCARDAVDRSRVLHAVDSGRR